MSDQDLRDLVIKHDTQMHSLLESIEKLARGIVTTNRKLEDMLSVINQQNVLYERIDNLDKETNKAIIELVKKIDRLTDIISTSGCELAKDLHRGKDTFDEKIKVANNRLSDLEDEAKGFIKSKYIYPLLIALLGYAVGFGTFVVLELQDLDNREIKCEVILGVNK